jgi:hypothetical protein
VSLADTEGVAGLAGRAGLAGIWPDDNAQRSATMPSNDKDQGRPQGFGLVRRSPVTLYGSEVCGSCVPDRSRFLPAVPPRGRGTGLSRMSTELEGDKSRPSAPDLVNSLGTVDNSRFPARIGLH